MRNWSLVCFTLFTQSAIGLVWVSAISRWLGKDMSAEFYRMPMFTALALSGIGLFMALTHLTKPRLAPNALRNLSKSWLSREVLMVQAFAGVVAFLILLSFLNVAGGRVPMEAAACLLGAVALFAMIRVYLIKTVPVWNSPATYLEFTGSAMLLGGTLGVALAAFGETAQPGYPDIIFASIAIALGLGLKVSAISPALAAEKAARAQTWYKSDAAPTITRTLAIRLGLYLGGLIPALAAFGWFGSTWLWSILSLACFGAAEVVGRHHFYQSYRRVGL